MEKSPAEIEAVLLMIPGVRAARVVADPAGTPIEVHIVAGGEKSAKQLVRDVQTVAQASLGMGIDHRIVSVVQFPDLQTAPPERRITIDEMTTETRGNNTRVRVLLSWSNVSSTGEAAGLTSSEGLLRIAAQATLEAVRGLLADGAWLALDHVSVQRVGSRDVVLATISLGGGGALSGSAVVEGQHTEAAVRAVLDALNRKLAPSEREIQRSRGTG